MLELILGRPWSPVPSIATKHEQMDDSEESKPRPCKEYETLEVQEMDWRASIIEAVQADATESEVLRLLLKRAGSTMTGEHYFSTWCRF